MVRKQKSKNLASNKKAVSLKNKETHNKKQSSKKTIKKASRISGKRKSTKASQRKIHIIEHFGKNTKHAHVIKKNHHRIISLDGESEKIPTIQKSIITLKIQRFRPEKDYEPNFHEYPYPELGNDTLLDAFRKIKWEQDDSFTFGGECRMGLCGACAVRINGHATLACETLLKDIIKDENVITVEPLKNFKIIKDLLVDMGPYWREMEEAKSWLVPKDTCEPLLPEHIKKIRPAGDCIDCGACFSDCSVVREDKTFMGPAALLKTYRFINDPRDKNQGTRLAYANKNGLWQCTEMFNCVEQCPKNIDIYKAIAEMRDDAIAKKLRGAGVRYTKTFTKTVNKTGRVDESLLMLSAQQLNIIYSYREAIRMIKHDKMPSLFPAKIKGYKNFKKMISRLQKDGTKKK